MTPPIPIDSRLSINKNSNFGVLQAPLDSYAIQKVKEVFPQFYFRVVLLRRGEGRFLKLLRSRGHVVPVTVLMPLASAPQEW